MLLIKRMEEIIQDRAAENNQKRRAFIEEAVDNFHKELSVDFHLDTEWSFVTAMYFAGTLFTTIGELSMYFMSCCHVCLWAIETGAVVLIENLSINECN